MRQNTRKIVLAAVFAALIFVVTAYLPRFPIPPGYIHFGDAFIYIAACLLPGPYAAAAAAVGAVAADTLTGFAVWAPATLVIKAVMALTFSSHSYKIATARNMLAMVIAGLIGTAGYYLYEALFISSFSVALVSVPGNMIQGAGSAVIFAVAALALDKADIKKITDKKI
ncbi:MAG: TIGR04002 family protein [Eubacteriales bacterium]